MSIDKLKASEESHQRNQASSRVALLVGLATLVSLMMLKSVDGIVIYEVRFISSKTGRVDYALAGESIELTSHYVMRDDDEFILQVDWRKDGVLFARWRKDVPGIYVYGYSFKGKMDNSSTYSHLTLHNVTIDMAGRYTCSILTDLGWGEEDQGLYLVVVSQPACTMDDWRVTSKQTDCRETFRLDCRHMFPRPAQRCGFFDSRTGRLIRAVTINIDEEPPSASSKRRTYRIQYVDQVKLSQAGGLPDYQYGDLLQFAGHLEFKCDIFVPDTSWGLSLSHKMFDFSDGCEEDPLEAIERMRASYSQYALQRLQRHEPLQNGTLERSKAATSQFLHMAESSNFTVELLLPSEVKRLRHLNTFGGPGEHELSSSSTTTMRPNSSESNSIAGDLNCWLKPRIGSIVKLSCADQQVGLTRKPLRLVGSNLLECRANGWNLVRESNLINNELLDKKVIKARVNKRRKLVANYLWPHTTKPPKRRTTTPETTTLVSAATATDQTPLVSEDNDDSSGASTAGAVTIPSTQTIRSPTTEVEEATIPTLEYFSSSVATDEEANADQYMISLLEEAKRGHKEEIDPKELADLLPTCVLVSTKRRKIHHKPSSGDLPLLESNANMQESSLDERHYRISDDGDEPSSQQDHGWPNWKWVVSGSEPSCSSPNSLTIAAYLATSAAIVLLQLQHRQQLQLQH